MTVEHSVTESDELLRFFMESAADYALLTLDAQGCITDWNAGAQRLFGYSEVEIIDQSAAILWVHQDWEQDVLSSALQAAQALDTYECWLKRKDGTRFWASSRLKPVRDEAGKLRRFAWIIRDLTEVQRLEQENALKANLLDAVEQAIITTDLDGIITYCNPYVEKLYGWSALEVIGHDVTSITPAEVSVVWADEIMTHLRRGERWSGEFLVRRKDGTPFEAMVTNSPIIDHTGSLVGILGVSVDITERKRAEAALRESQRFIQQIADTAPSIIYLYDLVDGRSLYANRQSATILGYTQQVMQEMGAEFLLKLMHPDDLAHLPEYEARIENARDGEVLENEYRVRRADGSWCWLHAHDTVFKRAPDGKPLQLLGTAEDITQRKQSEQERDRLLESERATRAEAERASRIKDEFLATLSHELRTPLNAILGWANLLRSGRITGDAVTDGLASIERNARVQTQIVEDLLDMSRIIAGKIRLDVQNIELDQVIDAAIETVRPAAEARQIRLVKNLDPIGRQIPGDPNRLQQVFWNLLSNAIKFTPPEGTVEVSLRHRDGQVEVSVKDTGQGIKPEFLPYVFERFRQADASTTRRHGGLGLGLSLVKQLVEMHGGSVSASSGGEGQGSTLTVTLPLTPVTTVGEPESARLINLGDSPSNGSQMQVVERSDTAPEQPV